jgi:murein tripeptide amidase MpaA
LDANIHATEISGTTVTMYITDFVLTRYGKDPQVTRILDKSVIYVVPRLNPDGAAMGMAANPRYVRSGIRYYPYGDREEGLHDQDIDGNGKILQMRIKDPNGDWKISSLDPRLMEKRQPTEVEGEFYRLLPEGLIEDYDGQIIKLAHDPEGLDFNRNFPFQWRPESEQPGAGPYPASEPEIKAVADFFAGHKNINVALTYHTFSGLLLRPYSTKPDDDTDKHDNQVAIPPPDGAPPLGKPGHAECKQGKS